MLYNIKKVGEDLIITSPQSVKDTLTAAIAAKESGKSGRTVGELSGGEKTKYKRILSMLGFYYLLPEFIDIDLFWPLFNLKDTITKEAYRAALHDDRDGNDGHFIFYSEEMNIPDKPNHAIINKYNYIIANAEKDCKYHQEIELFRFKISDMSPELKDLVEKYHPGILTSVKEDIVEDTKTISLPADISSKLNNLLTAAELLYNEVLDIKKYFENIGIKPDTNENCQEEQIDIYYPSVSEIDRLAETRFDSKTWEDFKTFANVQFTNLCDTPTVIKKYHEKTGIIINDYLVKPLLRYWREDFVKRHNIDITPYYSPAPKKKLMYKNLSRSNRRTQALKRAIKNYFETAGINGNGLF